MIKVKLYTIYPSGKRFKVKHEARDLGFGGILQLFPVSFPTRTEAFEYVRSFDKQSEVVYAIK